jgi:DNA helicase-4
MVDHCINRVGEHLSNGYDPQDLMILVRIAKNPRLMNLLLEGAKARGIKLATSRRNPKAVPVMSIHKSKGLQAKAVFLLNVIDHTYGLPCTLEDLDVFAPAIEGIPRPREEEERRLFYVAITRAKASIIITKSGEAKGKLSLMGFLEAGGEGRYEKTRGIEIEIERIKDTD